MRKYIRSSGNLDGSTDPALNADVGRWASGNLEGACVAAVHALEKEHQPFRNGHAAQDHDHLDLRKARKWLRRSRKLCPPHPARLRKLAVVQAPPNRVFNPAAAHKALLRLRDRANSDHAEMRFGLQYK